MKAIIIAAAGFLTLSGAAFAQTTPSSNATTLGTQSPNSNSAGMPSAATPAGQVTSTGGTASPPAMSSQRMPGAAAPASTADSTTTGTTTAPAK